MHSTPRFLQGIFPFEGQGVDKPVPVHESLTYTVPMGVTTQPLYFRGGNSTDELVTVVLRPRRRPDALLPDRRRGTHVHVALAVVEDLDDDTVLELHVAAREGLTGTVVVDLGLVEVWRWRPRRRPTSSSSGTAWPAPAPSRRSSNAAAATQFRITMFGDEPYGNYNRIMLSHVLAGDDAVRDDNWKRSTSTRWTGTTTTTSRCTPACGSCASTGSRRRSSATTARSSRTTSWSSPPAAARSSRRWTACGSTTRRSPRASSGSAPSTTPPRCSTTPPDSERRTAVVIGAGLLGLEAAYGLMQHGHDVHVSSPGRSS